MSWRIESCESRKIKVAIKNSVPRVRGKIGHIGGLKRTDGRAIMLTIR